jgi:hypothetical protein
LNRAFVVEVKIGQVLSEGVIVRWSDSKWKKCKKVCKKLAGLKNLLYLCNKK